MAKTIAVPVVQVEIRTIPLTKSVLKQMDTIETGFTREYLPGGKEAQDEDYTILGWVHGSVLEVGETHWCWLVVLVRRGVYIRVRVSRDDLKRWAAQREWAAAVPQLYL